MVHTDGKAGGPEHRERNYHEFKRHFEGASRKPDDLKVEVFNGALRLTWKNDTEEIKLPEDAFTTDYRATLKKDELSVSIGIRDPQGPAMLEKQALDPDFPHPRPLTIRYLDPQHNISPPDVIGHGQPSPAQIELEEHTTNDLLTTPLKHVAMPDAGMAGSVVTDNPVFVSKGGVMAAPSSGETITRKPDQVETHTDTKTGVVVQGMREAVLQAEHSTDKDSSYTTAAMGALGLKDKDTDKITSGGTEPVGHTSAANPPPPVAAEPAGAEGMAPYHTYPDEYESYSDYELQEDEFIDEHGIVHKRINEDTEKVGMATSAVTAQDRYPRADDSTYEPISTMKQQATGNAQACDVCDCAPCQCDKISKTHAPGFEMSGPETKKAGGFNPKHHKTRIYKHKQKNPLTSRRLEGQYQPPMSQVKSRVTQRDIYYDNTEKPRLHAEPTEDLPTKQGGVNGGSATHYPVNTMGEGDEQQTLPKPKGSGYTGGRYIEAPNQDGPRGISTINLTSGRHKPPHVLG